MFSMNIPNYSWGDVVLTTSYLINRMPTRALNYVSPLNCLKKHFPFYCLTPEIPLKVFGCTSYVHKVGPLRSKLEPRAENCVFIEYDPKKKGYKCFNPTTQKAHVSMDVSFIEDQPFFSQT